MWRYSVLQAGLAITPGPFVAAAVAGPAGRLADRFGPRWLLFTGGLIWAAGVGSWSGGWGSSPISCASGFPAMIVLGIGAGITFPVVGAAAVASVSGGRFATATGLNSVSRQLGAVLGVSLLVAIIGTPSPAEVADAFDHGWRFAAACFFAVALGSLLIGPVVRARAEGEAPRDADEARARTSPAPAGGGARAERAVTAPAGPRTPHEILRAVPLFAGLGDEALAGVASRATSVRLEAGDVLFRLGDTADALYVVVSGRLEALGDESADGDVLRVLGPGAVVGELALLAGSPRSATIRARRDAELFELRRAEFERLMGTDAGFTTELVREMGLRLQQSRALEQAGPAPASTIAIVSATSGTRFDTICDALVDGLAAHGRTIRVDPRRRGRHRPGRPARALRVGVRSDRPGRARPRRLGTLLHPSGRPHRAHRRRIDSRRNRAVAESARL